MESPVARFGLRHTRRLNTTTTASARGSGGSMTVLGFRGDSTCRGRLGSDWKVGSKLLYLRDGKVGDEHTVLAVDPPHSLVHSFHPVFSEEFRLEPPSRVSFKLEQSGAIVRLTVVHDEFQPNSKVFPVCSQGWPMILSNLKTLLETGKPLPPFGH